MSNSIKRFASTIVANMGIQQYVWEKVFLLNLD